MDLGDPTQFPPISAKGQPAPATLKKAAAKSAAAPTPVSVASVVSTVLTSVQPPTQPPASLPANVTPLPPAPQHMPVPPPSEPAISAAAKTDRAASPLKSADAPPLPTAPVSIPANVTEALRGSGELTPAPVRLPPPVESKPAAQASSSSPSDLKIPVLSTESNLWNPSIATTPTDMRFVSIEHTEKEMWQLMASYNVLKVSLFLSHQIYQESKSGVIPIEIVDRFYYAHSLKYAGLRGIFNGPLSHWLECAKDELSSKLDKAKKEPESDSKTKALKELGVRYARLIEAEERIKGRVGEIEGKLKALKDVVYGIGYTHTSKPKRSDYYVEAEESVTEKSARDFLEILSGYKEQMEAIALSVKKQPVPYLDQSHLDYDVFKRQFKVVMEDKAKIVTQIKQRIAALEETVRNFENLHTEKSMREQMRNNAISERAILNFALNAIEYRFLDAQAWLGGLETIFIAQGKYLSPLQIKAIEGVKNGYFSAPKIDS
jgi:hypothetical protein